MSSSNVNYGGELGSTTLGSEQSKDQVSDLKDHVNFLKTSVLGAMILSLVFGISTTGVAFGFVVREKTYNNSIQKAMYDFKSGSNDFVWTKLGLEQIPFEHWRDFSGEPESSLYIKNLPFPGEEFNNTHLGAWKMYVSDGARIENLLEKGFILPEKEHEKAKEFAADIGSTMIGNTASKGRLVSPASHRLREHFYRFPDQCDATPIVYDQVEAFFHKEKIGLFHDLFNDVDHCPCYSEELSVACWYGERYAESNVHQITNKWVYPLSRQNIDAYMLGVGLDPYDKTEDPSTLAGLGNVVGNNVVGKRLTEWLAANDGRMKDNNFVDVAGLEHIDEYHSTQNWANWKPTYTGSEHFQGIPNGIVTKQTFVSPSLGIFSFLYENEQD